MKKFPRDFLWGKYWDRGDYEEEVERDLKIANQCKVTETTIMETCNLSNGAL